jgi:hypothetical protein
MIEVTSNEPMVVRRSQIQPEILKQFFDGFIREHGDRDPYNFANGLEAVYPDFQSWFCNRVEPEFGAGKESRELLMLMASNQCETEKVIAGFAILKRTSLEKKICAFRISDGWRERGYGEKLMQECFKQLGTERPLITISDKYLPAFCNIIKKYKFQQTQVLPDYYLEGSTEYVFNENLKK